jgi:hypothetical protein
VQAIFRVDGYARGDQAVDLTKVLPEPLLIGHFEGLHDTPRGESDNAFFGVTIEKNVAGEQRRVGLEHPAPHQAAAGDERKVKRYLGLQELAGHALFLARSRVQDPPHSAFVLGWGRIREEVVRKEVGLRGK